MVVYSNTSLISHINPLMQQFDEIRFRISGFLIPRTSNTNFRSRGILKSVSGLGDIPYTVGNSQASKKKVLDGAAVWCVRRPTGGDRACMDRSLVRSGPVRSDPVCPPSAGADSDRIRALLSLVVNKNSTATLSDFPARLSYLLPIGCWIFFVFSFPLPSLPLPLATNALKTAEGFGDNDGGSETYTEKGKKIQSNEEKESLLKWKRGRRLVCEKERRKEERRGSKRKTDNQKKREEIKERGGGGRKAREVHWNSLFPTLHPRCAAYSLRTAPHPQPPHPTFRATFPPPHTPLPLSPSTTCFSPPSPFTPWAHPTPNMAIPATPPSPSLCLSPSRPT